MYFLSWHSLDFVLSTLFSLQTHFNKLDWFSINIYIFVSPIQVLKEAYCATIPQKLLIVMFIFPIVLFCWIRNLNTLSPLSFIANLSIVIGLIVVLYDEVFQFVNKEGAAITKSHACGNLMSISLFTGTALYSLEGIGVVINSNAWSLVVIFLLSRFYLWRIRCKNQLMQKEWFTLAWS